MKAHTPAVPWTLEDVGAFLGAYGRAPVRLTVEQLRSWWFNLVLRVEADGERLVLRRYGVTPPEEVLWELALLGHLNALGFPTIAPLARDGEACSGVSAHGKAGGRAPGGGSRGSGGSGNALGEFLGKPAILYPFVEGENGCTGEIDRAEAMTQTAATIARLHEVTAGLVLPHPRVRSGTDSRRMLRELLEHVRQRGVAAHEPALRTLVEQAERALAQFEARLAPHAAGLPRGVVHHDAHCANVLFRDGRLVALIDFDDACEGHLVADLAVMIANWAATFGGDDALDLSRAALVLRAYERQRRLTAGERDLLPDFVLLFLLGDASAYVQGRLEQGADGDQAVHDCSVYRRYVHHAHDAAWADALRRSF